MKALVISPQPFFTPRGTPFSVYYRTLITAELGVEMDLLTYGEGDDVDIPGLRIIRIPRFAFLGHVKTGPSLLKLFLDIFMVIWTIQLLIRNRYDFVHAHEEAVFYCHFLKPLFRFKLVYDMHSSLPQQLSNFQFTKSKLLIGLFKNLEDACLKSSDAVITICPDLEKYVMKIIHDKRRHFLIENSIFETVKVAGGRTKSGANDGMEIGEQDRIAGRKLIVYSGTLEHYQGIDILIGAVQTVIKEHPEAFLLIVGGSPSQVEYYSDIAKQKGVQENILFTGRVSHSTAKYYNSIASVIVSPRSAGTNTPLKIYELLDSGIPIVATNICSHTQVLDDSVAYLVAPDTFEMAKGIIAAMYGAEDRNRIVRNAKQLYERMYSRKMYVEKMQNLLKILA